MNLKKFTLALFTLTLILMLSTVGLAAEVDLRIYHLNDVHARIEADDYAGSIGYAKVATLLKQARREKENVMFLDAGDTFHGQTIANINQGAAVVYLLNLMQLDAMAIGNHDFNYGQQRLSELAEIANFPLLSANLNRTDGSMIDFKKDFIIKQYGDLKVGVFGLSTPETAYKTHPKNVEGLIFRDPVTTARKMVAQLSDKVDVIIAVTHLGISEGSKYTSKKVAAEVPGIDLIVDGHSHNLLPHGMMVNDTLIVQTGEYSKNLGYVDLTINNGQVTNKTANLIPEEETKSVKADYLISTVIERINRANELITSQVVGSTAVELDGAREHVRTGETNLGNLITDAMKAKLDTDVAITNGGGIRASIDQGQITQGEVISVLPFGNTAMAIQISGADLKAALEHGVSEYPAHEGLFPQISGIKFTFKGDAPVGERVQEVWVNGKQLDPAAQYTVATNDFMKAGGDGYTMFSQAPVVKEVGGLEEVLMDYIAEHSPIKPAVEDRIIVK